ncbi:hypothetical protein ACIPC1_24705 [Streptomyces sp. NPDC087263]|uniref:hypothetical protein n=1 Tax=Streptomyces sp. NPDC087263 TaxID=3365773 RepID=UPI0037FB03EC
MSKAGRTLEELVATLETLLSGSAVEVRSPEYIVGNSGSRREVDVSLRTRVGSVDILVILECRDRGRVQDIEWIDQLVGKREDVGATKAVAVSRTGFTAGAQTRAGQANIELRTIESVNSESVWGWLGVELVTVLVRKVDIRKIQINIPVTVSEEARLAALQVISQGVNVNSPILVRTDDGVPTTLGDLWRDAPKPSALDSLPSGVSKRGVIHIVPGDPNGNSAWYAILTEMGRVPISEIRIEGEFQVERSKVPFTRFEYRGGDESLAEGVYVDISHEGKTARMGVHSASDGSKFVVMENPSGIHFQADLLFGVVDD